MWQSFLTIGSTNSLRISTITLFCLGFTYASTVPYLSIIGVDQLGMSTWQFSVLGVAAAMAGMVGSLLLGHLSDQVQNRKTSILSVLAVGALGFGAFAFFPSVWGFVFCLVVTYPISNSAYPQLFAVIRTQTNKFGEREAVAINSVVRSIYAGSWILVPGLVGLFIATRKNVSDAYAIGAGAFALCFCIYAVFGLSGKNETPNATSAWQGLKAAVTLVANRRIFYRILALGMIATVHPANSNLMPLFITHLHGGSTKDVGIISGLVAGLEIPFMLLGGYFNHRTALWKIIIAAGLVHALYFMGLGMASSLWHIYALAVLNAAGAAILLSLHLSYVQELLPDRPGLGTSLLSISSLLYRTLGALVFASVDWVGFSGAVWFGTAIAVSGCILLYVLEGENAYARRLF
jgi:predicted MFS family arabinose efflux permease